MTPAQRAAVREVLAHMQNSGVAFAYFKTPEYTPEMALAEIERILAGGTK